uniref:Nitrate transporter n=1 Tax=Rhizophora mucronata TaxID=61149 RepID=A0A2P2IZ96_RHIMU
MRSIGGSLSFLGVGVSNYISGFLISIVHKKTKGGATGDWLPEDLNKGRLDYFYYLVAVLGVINMGYFIACAKWYRYKSSNDSAPEVGMENLQSQKPPA